ncbi:MAG: asparagine synthase (glutamine-hydrolyzing) [Planctomycetota bacterium]|jgi:asparagine synthase (glutamine-hydrolysing)
MCGICGIVSSENLRENDFTLVSAMNDSMAHRGPDDSGQFRDDKVMLAMRRLSIIDLAGGKQPLTNEDNSIVLVANGEIYNYIELRDGLKARGHRFRTGSDCETIVHLYEESGVEFLEKLRGMFALALWDKKNRKLFLARDRIGEKPLYLWQQAGRLIFASELRTLVKALPHNLSLDPAGVDMYMHYQYVPEPTTIVKDVNKLRAGHFLLISPAPWQVISKQYWNIESVTPINHNDPPQRILQELQEVTSLTLRSDVPVGIALSGGMDSNAIAALSKPKYSGDLHAFTVGYEGRPECDETDKARLIAREYGLPFHQIKVSVDDFVRSFQQLVFCSDDPVADIAAYGYFSVMKEARKHDVPVMLTGFGGDELFWGYPWVVEAMIENTKKMSLLGDSPEVRARLAREMTFYERHYDFKTAEQILPMLYTSSFTADIPPQNSFKPFRINEPYDSLSVRICRALLDTWLVSNCIVLGDRLSMASSVELRLPLLDYKLVELVMGLRKTYKTDHTLEPKIWLKEAVRNILPERVMNYPKRGFTPPVHQWISAAVERYGHLLTDGCLVESSALCL